MESNNCKEYIIKDINGTSWAKILPESGGLVSEFYTNNGAILYFDEKLLNKDIKAGGIPILFPVSSSLKNGEYKVNGRTYKMPFHGFAWYMPWDMVNLSASSPNEAVLEFQSNEKTMEHYPYQFSFKIRYVLNDGELCIYQSYTNNSNEEMPFYTGFHPYFVVGDKSRLKFDIPSREYIDYGDKQIVKYTGSVDFDKPVDFVFNLDNNEFYSYSMSDMKLMRKIVIEASKEFKHMVMWTMKDKNFVCIEPWMGIPDSMNSGIDLYRLAPGKTLETWIKIKVESIGIQETS